MAVQSDRKIAEGLEHLRNAEKNLKTSLFKWKPDYESAIYEYQKAAVAFKVAKAYEQATASYLKAAEAQKSQGSAFHAAKSLEQAALMYRDMKELGRAAQLMEEASTLYLEHGTPDTAAIALDRCAKMIENELPDRAIALYLRACDVAEGEDCPRQCAELIGKANRLMIRHRKLEDAAKALQREMDYYAQVENHGVINKLVMGLVLIQLHRGDVVAGDQAFKAGLSYPGFAESDESGPIEQLLRAYEESDQETADTLVRNPLFRYMENDFTKLARDLRVPGGGKKKVKSTTADGKEVEEEEDDYAEGLL